MCTRPPAPGVPPAEVSCEGSALLSFWKPAGKPSAPALASPHGVLHWAHLMLQVWSDSTPASALEPHGADPAP